MSLSLSQIVGQFPAFSRLEALGERLALPGFPGGSVARELGAPVTSFLSYALRKSSRARKRNIKQESSKFIKVNIYTQEGSVGKLREQESLMRMSQFRAFVLGGRAQKLVVA